MVPSYRDLIERVRQFFRSPLNRWGSVLLLINVLLLIVIGAAITGQDREPPQPRRPPSEEAQAFVLGMLFGAALAGTFALLWSPGNDRW